MKCKLLTANKRRHQDVYACVCVCVLGAGKMIAGEGLGVLSVLEAEHLRRLPKAENEGDLGGVSPGNKRQKLKVIITKYPPKNDVSHVSN